MRKLREVARIDVSTHQYIYDPLFSDIFGPDADSQGNAERNYIQSDLDPVRYSRFDIRPDKTVIGRTNPFIENFSNLKTNEQHVLNKIFFGVQSLTAIVATIGAGKSSLVKFVISQIEKATVQILERAPLQVYVNLNNTSHLDILTSSKDDNKILSAFYEHLNTEIRSSISDIIDLNGEIITFWDRILRQDRKYLGLQLKNVCNLLRKKNLDNYSDVAEIEPGKRPILSFEEVFRRRNDLLEEVTRDHMKHTLYLMELLGHIKKDFFQDASFGVIIYIDNVDHLSFKAQHVIRQSVYPILNGSHIRSIFPMRVSTWRTARKSDDFAFTVDAIPHCGPEPLQFVASRLENAKSMLPSSRGITGIDEVWHKKLDELMAMIRRPDQPISRLLTNLCGVCLRRSNVLSQYLVASLEFQFADESVRQHAIKRMIVCQGPSESYEWNPEVSVENLYCVYTYRCVAPLAKIRLISLLDDRGPEKTIGGATQMLAAFGMGESVARAAINELMQARRRLVWADSLLYFNEDEFSAASSTLIAASTVANGYLRLAGDLDYLEEVALDALINNSSAQYMSSSSMSGLTGKLELTLQFCDWLFRKDCEEIQYYFARGGSKEQYAYWFRSDQLLSARPIRSCLESLKSITQKSPHMGSVNDGASALLSLISSISLESLSAGDVVLSPRDSSFVITGKR